MSTLGMLPESQELPAQHEFDRARWVEYAPTFTGSMLALAEEEIPRVARPGRVSVGWKMVFSTGSHPIAPVYPGMPNEVARSFESNAIWPSPVLSLGKNFIVYLIHPSVEEHRLEQAPASEAAVWVHAIRDLIERDRIAEARRMTEKIPASALANPHLATLKRVLAPPRTRISSAKGVNRSREVAWLREHSDEYRGKWVALYGDTLVGAGDSLKDLLMTPALKTLPGVPLIQRIPLEPYAEVQRR